MKERIGIAVETSSKVVLQDGTEITAERTDRPKSEPSEVARHEAAHAIVAGQIFKASVIPSGSTLGLVQPKRMDAATAAAGAVATGTDSGAGWDRMISERYLGVPWSVSKSMARSRLAGQEDFLTEVANELDSYGVIYQSDMDAAKHTADRKKNGIFPVFVEIEKDGKKIEAFQTDSFNGLVYVSPLKSDLIH